MFEGLSGGDTSELGVVLLFLLDGTSETSPDLSNIGSAIWLSGESIVADGCWQLSQDIYCFCLELDFRGIYISLPQLVKK